MATFGRARGTSSICTADRTTIRIRDRDFTRDILGRHTFTQFFYFHMLGKDPTPQETAMLDALLVSIVEHGMAPTVQTARMTLFADPDALQAAVAAGILGCGKVILGSAEDCARLLVPAIEKIDAGAEPKRVALELATRVKEASDRLPGWGHPLHKPFDPRSTRLFEIAEELGFSGRHVEFVRTLDEAAGEVWGKPLVLNVQAAIAAILLDMDFPAGMAKSIPLLARTAGILGHLYEEQRNPIGIVLCEAGVRAIDYEKDVE